MFGDRRLPEAAEVVRARLAALFQPAYEADDAGEPPGEPPERLAADDAGHLPPARRLLTGRHVLVVAVLCLAAVAGSVAWSMRARAVPIAVAASSAQASTSSDGGAPSETPSPAPSSVAPTLVVHVLGAVVSPGVVRLAGGARVEDALAAAGGLRADADPAELNLAAVLTDGCQVVIGTKAAPRGEVRSGPTAAAAPAGAATTAQLDLNAATLAQLDTLPGVGPVTAQAIIDYRSKHGRFTRIEELQEVDGIGAKTYAQIAPYVRV